MRQDAQGWCPGMTLRDGMGREVGEGGSGWETHAHPWLIHVNVWQKPPQYYKVISLQLKIKKYYGMVQLMLIISKCVFKERSIYITDICLKITDIECNMNPEFLLGTEKECK